MARQKHFFLILLRFFFCGTVFMVGVVPLSAAEPPAFVGQGIETFDGKTWSGLTLGVTTQEAIKKQFRNGRGEFSTSVELKPENTNLPYRISALYENRDKKAKLQGICIHYRNEYDGFPISNLQNMLGAGEGHYATRYEDWNLIVYPNRGILLFELNKRVPMIILGYPDRIVNTANTLIGRETQIEPYPGAIANQPRILRFSDIKVSYCLDGLSLDNEYKERCDTTNTIYRATAGGAICYQPNTNGSYHVTVTANYTKDKGGDGSVQVAIDGYGIYGYLSTCVSKKFDIDSGREKVKLEDTRYLRALNHAMEEAECDIAEKLRDQEPPPIWSFRSSWWSFLMDKYRFHANENVAVAK